MTYNLVKLIGVFALAAFIIVAMGVDWVGEVQGWATIGILVGYVVGNMQVTSQTGYTAPIVGRPGE